MAQLQWCIIEWKQPTNLSRSQQSLHGTYAIESNFVRINIRTSLYKCVDAVIATIFPLIDLVPLSEAYQEGRPELLVYHIYMQQINPSAGLRVKE